MSFSNDIWVFKNHCLFHPLWSICCLLVWPDHQVYHDHVPLLFPIPTLTAPHKPPTFTTFYLYWSSFCSLHMPSYFSLWNAISLDFHMAVFFLSFTFHFTCQLLRKPSLSPHLEFSVPIHASICSLACYLILFSLHWYLSEIIFFLYLLVCVLLY